VLSFVSCFPPAAGYCGILVYVVSGCFCCLEKIPFPLYTDSASKASSECAELSVSDVKKSSEEILRKRSCDGESV
jgi:hypothetical protein